MALFGISDYQVLEIIKRHFDTSDMFAAEKYKQFLQLIENKKEIAAAKEYCSKTGSSIAEARLAVYLAKNLV